MAVLFLRKFQGFIAVLAAIALFSPLVASASMYPFTDPFMNELWYWNAIHVPSLPQEGKETIVAVLDAGFDMDHPDLKNQYWTNPGEIPGDHKDNDHNGYEDDVHGWDFVDSDANPSPDVSNPNLDTIISHGTLLAGMISAEANNGSGAAGIASRTKIMPLRILNSQGKGNTTDVIAAIEYAVHNGADVINISFTSTQPDDRLQKSIEWAVDQGVTVVAAIGNENVDTNKTPTYPACFDTRIGKNTVIGVAATDETGKRASFSNYGTNCVDLSAPGVNIFGPVYFDPSQLLFSTAYGSPFEGTSMAAPMVTAAVALMRSAYPSLTPNQIRLSLMLSATPSNEVSVADRQGLGAGILNIDGALKTAAIFVTGGGSEQDSKHHTSGSMVVAQGFGSAPTVERIDKQGKTLAVFSAYDPHFRGGVRVAMGDVNGNGKEEIITGAGPGGGPQIRIFDLSGKLINQFFALDPSNRGGVFVTTGDVNHDGVDEILVTQDNGGNGQVRIFNKRGEMQGTFYPFGRTTLPVHVTVGNFDDDPEMEIASTLGGKNKDHRVRVFDANGRYLRDFTAIPSVSTGLRVSTLHVVGQKTDEILVSAEKGSSPWFSVYQAAGGLLYSNLAYAQNFKGGVDITSGDLNGDGIPEIYTTPLSLGGPQIRSFNAFTDPVGSFFVFNEKNRNGLSIAVWNP